VSPTDLQSLLARPPADAIAPALREAILAAQATALPAASSTPEADALLVDTLRTLTGIGADGDAIAAALLHARPELQPAVQSLLLRDFPLVATLLESQRAAARVCALHGGRDARAGRGGAEGWRRLLLAIVRDLRVLPLLLSGQLARMRDAARLAEPQRQALARLTRDIHAPLANRLGIWRLKWELEDLALRYLEPATYQRIAHLLDETRAVRERHVGEVAARLHSALTEQGIAAEVAGRSKHITSIWNKMQRKDLAIDQLHDLRAVRVLVDDIPACYAALGTVHALWAPVAGEFDDYIARPKANDYRSLHTAVVGPDGRTVEVQIRSREMHRLAELGVAAHWRYKEGVHGDAALDRKVAWMRRLLLDADAAADAGTSTLAAETQAAEDRIYALTPQDDVIELPQGATPLDFAYRVHTQVGHRCRGARVDGRIVPLDHVLRSGDRVEILTGKTAQPRRDWLVAANGFLATDRSRDKVRAWFHRLDQARNATDGRALLERELRRCRLLQVPLDAALSRFGMPDVDSLHVAVGLGEIGAQQVSRALLEQHRDAASPVPPEQLRPRAPAKAVHAVTVQGIGGLLVQRAGCCQPLPGEAIAGYLTRGRGVSVHRPDCAAYQRLVVAQPQRQLQAEWAAAATAQEIDVLVDAQDRKWLVKEVSNVIAEQRVQLAALHSEQGRGDGGRLRLRLRLRLGDSGQLARLLGRLDAVPGVERARRA